MPIPSYILPSAPAYTEDSVYALIPTPSTPIYTPDAISFTRGSDATRTASNGLIQKSPVNLVQYSEEFTNSYWQKQGVAITSNAATAPNSTLTADLMYATTSATYEGILKTNFPLGSYTLSIYAKASGKNYLFFYVIGASAIQGVWFNIANGTIGTTGSVWTNVTITNVGNGWYRCSASVTLTNTTNYLYYLLSDADNNPNLTINGTDGAYIWGAQLVEGSQPLTYFPTTDRLNVPRIDFSQGSCPALLLEPQRTNSIRNSSAIGAVVGTPGTLPTNWGYLTTAGLTIDIVQLGTIGALNYIDYRVTGTATSSSLRLSFESNTQIGATVGQAWSYSLYAQSLTGTLPTSLLRFVERNSSGGALVTADQTIAVSSNFERFTYTRTTTNASCAYIVPELNFSITNGASYDFTFRIAQPQMELGAYATTPILTTGSASATRIADSFSRNNIYTNGLITSAGGTWFVELRGNIQYTRDAFSEGIRVADVATGSNNGFEIRNEGGFANLRISKRIAGASTTLFTTSTSTVKIAIKWNGSTADIFANGTKVVSATSFTTTNMEYLIGGAADVPKYIQSMALFSTPLSDATLITMTT